MYHCKLHNYSLHPDWLLNIDETQCRIYIKRRTNSTKTENYFIQIKLELIQIFVSKYQCIR